MQRLQAVAVALLAVGACGAAGEANTAGRVSKGAGRGQERKKGSQASGKLLCKSLEQRK